MVDRAEKRSFHVAAFAFAANFRYTVAAIRKVLIIWRNDMPTKLELAAFDLDGVIADTEPMHKNAKLRIFKEFGISNHMDLDKHVGRPNSELWDVIIRENDLDRTPKEFEIMQYDYILEQMREEHTPMSEGLLDLLDVFAGAGVRCGVCSSSDRYYVDKILAFFGLTGRFDPIVGGDQVPLKKPAPDGYLKLVADAGLEPGRAVAIEDSRAGVASAMAAGLRCIGYVNPTSGDQNLDAAFMKVTKLADIAAWIKRA